MAWTNAKTAIVAGVAVLLTAISVAVITEGIHERRTATARQTAVAEQPPASGPIRAITGIGILLRFDEKIGAPIVMNVLPNSPAADAGVANGVIVSRIDNRPTEGMKLRECIDLIRGAVGTKVRLELVTPTTHETNQIELTRQIIRLQPLPRATQPLP
jgi:carboxyl-terminal processing protease